MKAYLANSLFSLGDRFVNELIATEVRENIPSVDLYSPQENGDINNKDLYADSMMIAKADTEKLLESDFLICVIDGCEIDSGVSAEIGIFSTLDRPIFALYTDVRQHGRTNKQKITALVLDGTENQYMYKNLFVIGLIKQHGQIFDNVEALVNEIKYWSDTVK